MKNFLSLEKIKKHLKFNREFLLFQDDLKWLYFIFNIYATNSVLNHKNIDSSLAFLYINKKKMMNDHVMANFGFQISI